MKEGNGSRTTDVATSTDARSNGERGWWTTVVKAVDLRCGGNR